MSRKEIFGNILIAASFDKSIRSLIDTTLTLFQKRNFNLTFAHVVTPPRGTPTTLARSGEDKNYDLALSHELVDIASSRLKRLTNDLKDKVSATSLTIEGANAAETLNRYANDHKIDLIVIGTTKSNGLSTAMELIAKESKPILIVHENFDCRKLLKPHHLIINDDLHESGQSCLEWSFILGRILGESHYLHCYVETRAEFIENVKLYYGKPTLTLADTDTAISQYKRTRQTQLAKRFCEICEIEKEDLIEFYTNELSIGPVEQELERAAISYNADISIFAIRKIYDREFKYSGHIPFRSLIESERLVMIVPP